MYKCYSSSRCAHNVLQSTFKPYQWCTWYKNKTKLFTNEHMQGQVKKGDLNKSCLYTYNEYNNFIVNKSESMAFIGLSNLCGNLFEQFSSLASCENT